MIFEWVKREDYWTNISSPDFDRDLRYRGYLETRGQGLYGLRGYKKNGMWLLRQSSSELLRQDKTTDTGFVVRGCPDIPGGGSQAGQVQTVQESETGETPMAGKQSILHKAVFILCGEEVPNHDRQGCRERTQTGLACAQGIGEGIYVGTASAQSGGSAAHNRDRRNIFAEGTYLSDRGQRSGAGASDLAWRQRPV